MSASLGTAIAELTTQLVVLRLPLAPGEALTAGACSYWDTASQTYSDQGVVVVGWEMDPLMGQVGLLCAATHLTDFASKAGAFVPQTNSIDLAKDFDLVLAYDCHSMLVPVCMLCLVAVFIPLHRYAHVLDKREEVRILRLRMSEYLARGRVDGRCTWQADGCVHMATSLCIPSAHVGCLCMLASPRARARMHVCA